MAASEQDQPGTSRTGGRRLYLSRRRLLEAGLVTALGGVVSSLAPAAPLQEGPPELSAPPRGSGRCGGVQRRIRPWALGVADGAMARKADRPEDRHTYAVDVGQVMWYFATVADLEPYLALRRVRGQKPDPRQREG